MLIASIMIHIPQQGLSFPPSELFIDLYTSQLFTSNRETQQFTQNFKNGSIRCIEHSVVILCNCQSLFFYATMSPSTEEFYP